MRSLRVRPLQGSGPGYAEDDPRGAKDGDLGVGIWEACTRCVGSVGRGVGGVWGSAGGPGVSRESVCPPGGEGVLGELESAIPVGGGRWTGRAPGGFLGELGRVWHPGCRKGFAEV